MATTAKERPWLRLISREPAEERAAPRRDEHVHKAITLMHDELSARWTVTKLARRVGLSRPAFARRFAASMGMSPLRYLTRCRMVEAARLLVHSNASLSELGARVGYESEFAFNRAFKRFHGIAPGSFRRAQLGERPVFRAAA